MPNPLAAANVGALPNTGADPGPISGQGPQVDASAMGTPPTSPTMPGGSPAGAGGPQGKLQVDQVREATYKLSAIGAGLEGLLAKPGPIPRKDVIDVAVKLVSRRIMSAQMMAQTLKDLPEDPQEIREWVQRHATDVQNHELMLHKAVAGIRDPSHPLAGQLGPGFVTPPGTEQEGAQPGGEIEGGQPPTLQ